MFILETKNIFEKLFKKSKKLQKKISHFFKCGVCQQSEELVVD